MDENKKCSPRGLLLIVNALFWAGAMLVGAVLFKEQGWGNDMIMWMIVGYMVANGLLMAALGRKSRDCN